MDCVSFKDVILYSTCTLQYSMYVYVCVCVCVCVHVYLYVCVRGHIFDDMYGWSRAKINKVIAGDCS